MLLLLVLLATLAYLVSIALTLRHLNRKVDRIIKRLDQSHEATQQQLDRLHEARRRLG